VSNDPPETILIYRFAAQEKYLIIINAAKYFCCLFFFFNTFSFRILHEYEVKKIKALI